jgi:hypothetical protein
LLIADFGLLIGDLVGCELAQVASMCSAQGNTPRHVFVRALVEFVTSAPTTFAHRYIRMHSPPPPANTMSIPDCSMIARQGTAEQFSLPSSTRPANYQLPGFMISDTLAPEHRLEIRGVEGMAGWMGIRGNTK